MEELVYVVLIEVSVQQRELIISRGHQLYRPALQNLVIVRVAGWFYHIVEGVLTGHVRGNGVQR